MTHLDLFSGIGGFSLAFERAGFQTVAFCETESFPNRVLAERWPGVPNLGDIRGVDGDEVRKRFGPVDVVTFGSPCQGLSVAGKRRGFSDKRSALYYEAIRIVRDLRPNLALWENTPGAFSTNGGRDFGAALDALADIGAVDICWRVLDAQFFGVPQRRRRIFVVADFGGERSKEILFESEGVRGDTAAGKAARKDVAPTLRGGAAGGRSHGKLSGSDQMPMVAGTLGGGTPGGGSRPDTDRMTFIAYPLTARHAADWYYDSGTTLIAHTLTHEGFDASEDGTEQGTPLVHAFAENQQGELRTSNVALALSAGGGKPGMGYGAMYCATGVRRLTVLEAERLQGFPDGWTALDGASDSARYRALGNAVAVLVIEWIAKRTAKVLRVECEGKGFANTSTEDARFNQSNRQS